MTRAHAVAAAFGLFSLTLATSLLEGRVGTFLRPDPTSRFVYTVVANVLIRTVGAALVTRTVVRRAELPHVTPYGIARPLRILVLVPLAAVFARIFLVGQQLPTSDPVILANASAQVLVVSIAGVVVCWPCSVPFSAMRLDPGSCPPALPWCPRRWHLGSCDGHRGRRGPGHRRRRADSPGCTSRILSNVKSSESRRCRFDRTGAFAQTTKY